MSQPLAQAGNGSGFFMRRVRVCISVYVPVQFLADIFGAKLSDRFVSTMGPGTHGGDLRGAGVGAPSAATA
jgi:hypothetical protein